MLAERRVDTARGEVTGREVNRSFTEKLFRIKFGIEEGTALTVEQVASRDILEEWASSRDYILAVQTTQDLYGLGLYKPELAEFIAENLLGHLFHCINDHETDLTTFVTRLMDLFEREQSCREIKRQQIVEQGIRQFFEQFYRTKFHIAVGTALTAEQEAKVVELRVWANANDITPGALRPEIQASFATISADDILSLESFTDALKQILTVNRLLILTTDTARGAHDPILLKLLRNQSTQGVLGQEPDMQFILRGFITNPEEIFIGGKYIMTPCDWRGNVAGQVRNVLRHLEGNGNVDSINAKMELIIPVRRAGHWVLVTVTVENKKITGIELSDSMNGPSETPVAQRDKTRAQFRGILSGLFTSLTADSFAEHFTVNSIQRNEQWRNMYCMDYTIQAALRKAGKVLYNPTTGEDYYDLAYQSGSGDKAESLRGFSVDVMRARLEGRPVALRDWQVEQAETCTKVLAEEIIEAQKDNPLVKAIKFVGSGILNILWFVITLPFTIIKGAFDLGLMATTGLINAIVPPKSVTPPKSAAPLQPAVVATDSRLHMPLRHRAGATPLPAPGITLAAIPPPPPRFMSGIELRDSRASGVAHGDGHPSRRPLKLNAGG